MPMLSLSPMYLAWRRCLQWGRAKLWGTSEFGASFFLSFRRINRNPVDLARYLDRALYPGAVYLDILDPVLRPVYEDVFKHQARGPDPALAALGAASPPLPVLNSIPPQPLTPASSLPDRTKVQSFRATLASRIAATQAVVILLDRGFHRDFINARLEEQNSLARPDWVRFELETARQLEMDVFIVYGDSKDTLANSAVRDLLRTEYPEFQPFLAELLLCESAVVEFGTPSEGQQLRDLARRLKLRTLNYWRASTRRAVRLSWVTGFLMVVALAFTFWSGKSGTLQDWLRWRVRYPDRTLHLKDPQTATNYFESELADFNDHDKLANAWKKTLVRGYEDQERNKTLFAVRSAPFEKDLSSLAILVSCDPPFRITAGVAFLVDPDPNRAAQKYRQLPAKFHLLNSEDSSNPPPGSSLVYLPSPNHREYLLLLLLCECNGSCNTLPKESVHAEVQP